MFFIVVLLVWTAMHVYVLWRVATVPSVSRSIPRAWLIGVAAFLWLSIFLGRILSRAGAGFLGKAVEWVSVHWLGVLFLLLICLLTADIVTGFGHLLPRVAPAARKAAFVAAAILCVIALVQARRSPLVRDYEVTLPGLAATSDGTTVVVISDTHLGAMLGERWLNERIAQVQALKPDLIILAGDIVEGDSPDEGMLIPAFRRLSAPLGVFAVTGNHEYYAGLAPSVRLLENAGIQVLRDRWVELRPRFILAGVDDLTSRRRYRRDIDFFVERALANRPPGSATVYISHSPLQAEKAASLGAGLMLSGHTHNGQIWPFTYFVKRMYPLLAGEYDVNGMKAIVCRGTGTWGPRMRLWGREEIVRVVLRSPAKQQAASGQPQEAGSNK